jgi:N-acetyl-alpha-D-glucosaminyl L-malate synthase BshA
MPVKSEIAVIPNFLDCGFKPFRANPMLRTRLCPPDQYDKLVVHVSNFRPVKQIEAVVRVFEGIRRHVRARLLMVGEGPEWPKADRLVQDLGLSEHVEMIGEEPEVNTLLAVSDLFLLPSLQESFGLAALEAMACGVPVVASRVGGLPEVVIDGETGFLHPPADIEAMTASAVRILSDDDLHARLGAESRRVAVTRFRADRVVPRYEAFYRKVLERPVGSPR